MALSPLPGATSTPGGRPSCAATSGRTVPMAWQGKARSAKTYRAEIIRHGEDALPQTNIGVK